MTPWTRIDRADAPDGTRLELWRRGKDFSIRANGQLLMNTRVHGSEESLAELALSSLSGRAKVSVLVGGLGCGYTLAATLPRVGPDASIVVAEVEPAVVRWNRELLGELNGKPLDDARVSVIEGDICELFRSPRQRFDAILLDVDNGPRAVARESNGWLYSAAGLAGIRKALTPRGVLALWSAGPEVGFSERLRAAGLRVVLHRVRSHPSLARRQHMIWIGTNE